MVKVALLLLVALVVAVAVELLRVKVGTVQQILVAVLAVAVLDSLVATAVQVS